METKGISKLDLKRRNRKQILLAIRKAGMLARVDIAAQLSLTRAAVTIITNQMISQNILEDLNSPMPEPADAPKRKGRKKTMIRINPTFRYVFGVSITDHHISLGLSDLNNEVMEKVYLDIDEETDTEEIIGFIVSNAEELLKKSNLGIKQILGMGIAIAPSRWKQMRAVVDEDGKVSFSKLCYLLEMELSVPVCCGSAINLYALANIDHSADETANNILVYSGECYHSAVINENAMLLEQAVDTASIDRFVINPGGAAWEGYQNGSVHAEITRAALINRVREATGREMSVQEINDAYTAGDEAIKGVVNAVVDKIALLIYNLAAIHSAHRVILQNFQLCDASMEVLVNKVKEMTGDKVDIVISSMVGDQSFLAGSGLAIEKYFFETGGMVPGDNSMNA